MNQTNSNDLGMFWQNQQLNNSNINQSNLMLFQQQLKLGMLNNQHQPELQSLLNPNINLSQINNQTLLLYDKNTNSIIPIKQGYGQSVNSSPFNGSAIFGPIHLSGIPNAENTINLNQINTSQMHFDGDISKIDGVRCGIPHYFQGGNITLNPVGQQEKLSTQKIVRQVSADNNSVPLNLDTEQSESQTACFNKQSTEDGRSDLERISKTESFGITVKSSLEIKGEVVDTLNNRLQTGIRNIELSKLKASDFELNNRESEQFTLESKNISKVANSDSKFISESINLESAFPKKAKACENETHDEDESNKTKDNLIWISFDDNDSQQLNNKKKLIEKRMNYRNNQSKQKGSNYKGNSSAWHSNSKSRRNLQNNSNFEDVDKAPKGPKQNKDTTQETESKVSSVAQTPVHTIANKTRGLKPDWKNAPIMIDLFDSRDTSIISKNNGTLLESGDNPICSFSSKAGVIGLKAFQSGEHIKPKREEVIALPANDNATNSSLAEMFMWK